MTIANDDFSLPSPCFIFATSLPSSSQPGMQPCLGTHTWSPDLWSHYYTPNHCTVRPVSGRPIGLYTFCTRILTYSFASRMVYVTPGESYDVSPCHLPFCVFFANQLDTFQHAVDIARESFIELRDVEREQFILDVHVLANTSAVAATRMATTTLSQLYHIPGIFHPRQWPLAWLRYSISTPSSSISSPLDLSRTEKIGVHFRTQI
jgi:hypothetical protein